VNHLPQLKVKKSFMIPNLASISFNFNTKKIKGALENSRQQYDRYYMIDLSPSILELFKPGLDQIFVDGASNDAILIGHGEWIPDPLFNDTGVDRTIQLTHVRI